MTRQDENHVKTGAGAAQDREAPHPAHGIPAPAETTPSNGSADTPESKSQATIKERLRRWVRKPLAWALITLAGGIVAAGGAQIEGIGAGVIHHFAAGRHRNSTHGKRNTPALGMNEIVNYQDQLGVALAKPLKSGPGYMQLLQGLTDNGYGSVWGPFLTANHGAPVGELHLDLILTGQSTVPVRVTNVRIHMTGPPKPRLKGTYIPIPHAGGQEAFQFASHLDSASPVIVGVQGQQSFPDFNVTLNSNEQTTLSIDFYAVRYTYSWTLDVDYVQGTHRHTVRVTGPGGKPFLLTSRAPNYSVVYSSNFPAPGYQLDPGQHSWRDILR